jgi:hypothetical protein
MKRLFVVRKYKNGPVVPGLFFSDKMKAKEYRNELGDNAVVSYGPDHKKSQHNSGE